LPGDKITLEAKLFKKVDYIGAGLLVAGAVGVLLGVSFGGNQYPWVSPAVIVCFILGGLCLIIFVCFEWKFPKNPIISIPMLLLRDVGCAAIVSFGYGWGMLGNISYLPIYFQVVHGDSPTTSGLKLIPLMLGTVLMATVSGILITKTGRYYHFLIIGGILLILGIGLEGGLLSPDFSLYLLSFFTFISGLGVGTMVQTTTIISQGSVERKDIASVTAAIQFLRTMGGVIGVAVCGAVLNNRLALTLPNNLLVAIQGGYSAIISFPPDVSANIFNQYSSALGILFLSNIPAAALGLVAAVCIKNQKLQSRPFQPPPPTEM